MQASHLQGGGMEPEMKTRIHEGKKHNRVLLLTENEWNTIMRALDGCGDTDSCVLGSQMQ